jgi:hypothetical protein
MKAVTVIIAVLGMVVVMAVPASAQSSVELKANPYQELTEATLLNGLNCENCGVRAGAMFMVGDLKISRAVIPLMGILKGTADDKSKILAALSLCRIGDARGVYAVKRAAKFDESPRVRLLCGWYYNELVQPGSFEFGPAAGSESIAER